MDYLEMSDDRAQPGLRERKKAQLRDALVEAAYTLFAERGYDSVTVDDIVERAGVSQRTFFRYFPTKESVVFPFQDERIELFRQMLQQAAQKHGRMQAIRAGCIEMGRHFMSLHEELDRQQRIIRASQHLHRLQREYDLQWEGVFYSVIAKADLPEGEVDWEARRIAAATFGAVFAALEEWYASGCKDDLIAKGEAALSLIEAGIAEPLRRRDEA